MRDRHSAAAAARHCSSGRNFLADDNKHDIATLKVARKPESRIDGEEGGKEDRIGHVPYVRQVRQHLQYILYTTQTALL